MKYLFSLLFAGITLVTFAQSNGNNMMKNKQDFTPEQNAILQTKKMALSLDLNSSQQNQILTINKKQAAERKKKMDLHKSMKENGKKLPSDERFKMMNDMLDAKLAHQKEMKKVLNEKQYEDWKNMQRNRSKKTHHSKGKMMKAKGKNKGLMKENRNN